MDWLGELEVAADSARTVQVGSETTARGAQHSLRNAMVRPALREADYKGAQQPVVRPELIH